MGSGTTAVAAIGEGRNYIGIEKQPEYVSLARAACEKENRKLCFSNERKKFESLSAANGHQLNLPDKF
jgi:DNA modification methylase